MQNKFLVFLLYAAWPLVPMIVGGMLVAQSPHGNNFPQAIWYSIVSPTWWSLLGVALFMFGFVIFLRRLVMAWINIKK